MATMDTFALERVDAKGELPLLRQLTSDFNVETTDAMHLMSAHSARMDHFLKWDGKLIKRARKVDWLKPVAERPTEIIQRF